MKGIWEMKKFVVILLALSLLFCAVACDGDTSTETESSDIETTETEAEETTARHPKGDVVEIDDDTDLNSFCLIYGRKISFVERSEVVKLEEAIAKLLANEYHLIGEKSGARAYSTCPDPDSPSVPGSYSCALMDMTGDGVAELLLHPEGFFGSSGTATYFIYDVYSGEYIGSIDDGIGNPWCSYYNVENDSYYFMAQYYLRGGWSYTGTRLSVLCFNEERGEYEGRSLVSSSHCISMETETDEAGEVVGSYEAYNANTYHANKYDDTLGGYIWELYDFERNFIRIPETELLLIEWGDVCDGETDLKERAALMAHALVNSTQKIIKPDNISLDLDLVE